MLYRKFGKRTLDVTLSVVLLIVTAPVLALVATLVRWRLGSPAIFRQRRPGLNGEIFTLFKFRSMTNKRDRTGQLFPDEERLTPFGQFLRSSSLDELPELWNVLRGDMSLVGPRPLLVEYLDRYSDRQARRHLVKPGLTGWAQVNGRNAIDWERKFELDVWYVDRCSLRLDVWILLATVVRVLQRKDISADAHVAMPRFAPPEATRRDAA